MRLLLIVFLILTFAACKKDKNLKHYQQTLTNRYEMTVGYDESKMLDLDNDGMMDVGFRTYHIGDPLTQMDKIQFCAVSTVRSSFPVNQNDDVDIREKGSMITTNNGSGYEWLPVSLAVLAQKNISTSELPFWTGVWKDVQHKYLAIQLLKLGKRYNGWIKISFNKKTEKIIVHTSGISVVPEADLKIVF